MRRNRTILAIGLTWIMLLIPIYLLARYANPGPIPTEPLYPVETIKGNGMISSYSRTVSGVHTLDILFKTVETLGDADGYTIRLELGERESLSITTDENILKRIDIQQDAGRMTVSGSPSQRLQATRMDIVLTTNKLNLLYMEGGARITSAGKLVLPELKIHVEGSLEGNLEIRSSQLNVAINGAGSLELIGRSESLNLDVTGAATVDALGLLAQECRVELNGAGSCKITVVQRLDAIINGMGTVEYDGAPIVHPVLNGLGYIRKIVKSQNQ